MPAESVRIFGRAAVLKFKLTESRYFWKAATLKQPLCSATPSTEWQPFDNLKARRA